MARGKRFTLKQLALFARLRDQGIDYVEIARRTGFNATSIAKALRRDSSRHKTKVRAVNDAMVRTANDALTTAHKIVDWARSMRDTCILLEVDNLMIDVERNECVITRVQRERIPLGVKP